MARRNQSINSRTVLVFGIAGLVLLLGVGFFLLQRGMLGDDGGFGGLTHLNVSEYLENSKSLQGNTYQLEGKVEDQLGWSTQGRVLMVVSQGEPVGVKVPQEFSGQNIQPGQSFVFKVKISDHGVLVVEALKKTT